MKAMCCCAGQSTACTAGASLASLLFQINLICIIIEAGGVRKNKMSNEREKNCATSPTRSALHISVARRTELMLRGQWSVAIAVFFSEVVQMKCGVNSGLLNRDRAGSLWVRLVPGCCKKPISSGKQVAEHMLRTCSICRDR